MDSAPQLGKYRLLSMLASGGMGEVFLARQEGPAGFAKNVVIKRILRSLAADDAFVEMFLNEARLAALLEHPHVVQIFELGMEQGTYFIAMEYIHGVSLRRIRQRLVEVELAFPAPIAARLCSQALQGLHYAHELCDEQGERLDIVHRDVSPDNVLVGFNGVAKLVDFGIAKAAVNASTTRAGMVKGKYAYMAPEQLTSAGRVDGRADIYAMGVLLYELLSGVRPFQASTEPGLVRAILQDTPAPLRTHNPTLPAELEAVVMRALSRDPAQRFESAEQMSHALEAFISGTGATLTSAHVSAFLKQLFPDAASSKVPRSALTPTGGSTGSGARTATGSAPSVSSSPRRALDENPPTLAAVDMVVVEEGTPVRPARRRSFLPLAAVGLGLVAVGAGAAILLRPKPEPQPQPQSAAREAPLPSPQGGEGQGEGGAPRAPPPDAPRPAAPVLAAVAPHRQPTEAAEPTDAEPPEAEERSEPARRRRTSRPRPVAAAAPREEPAAPGTVVLRVNPWAEVFHGGKSLGLTPMDPVPVAAGRQRFVLKNSQLGVEKSVEVKVPAGGQVVLKADLLE